MEEDEETVAAESKEDAETMEESGEKNEDAAETNEEEEQEWYTVRDLFEEQQKATFSKVISEG